jgi:hypothetical protein
VKEKEFLLDKKSVGGTGSTTLTASGKLAAVREKFPNAGRGWTKDDDEKLTEMFKAEVSTKEIAKEFGRKAGAIRARLAKLGLIEDDYWAKRNKK